MFREIFHDRVQAIVFWLVLVALVIATIFFFKQNARLRAERARWVRGARVGQTVPPISGQGLHGQTVSLTYSGHGPRHVLLFFSPTSKFSFEQFIYWKQIINRADPNQFEVFALVSDFEDNIRMEAYLRADGLYAGSEPSLRLAFIPPSVRLEYGLITPPTTIVVSNLGTIENVWIGRWDDETVRVAGTVFGFTFSPLSQRLHPDPSIRTYGQHRLISEPSRQQGV